jgi:serine/threonine protein kinase
MGTANYVSPEQMKGEAVDQRTDIWSLGVILYEMLSGKRPFEADHREAVYYAIAHKTPEPIRLWRAGIPETLESLARRDHASANWTTTLMSSALRCSARRVTRRASHEGSARAKASPALYQCRLLALTLPTITLFRSTTSAATSAVGSLLV